MHTSFADQLTGLDLSGFSIGPAPVSTGDFPLREEVVQTLAAAAQTGKIGDGKIFIYEIADAIRIRNLDRGEAAL